MARTWPVAQGALLLLAAVGTRAPPAASEDEPAMSRPERLAKEFMIR